MTISMSNLASGMVGNAFFSLIPSVCSYSCDLHDKVALLVLLLSLFLYRADPTILKMLTEYPPGLPMSK